MRISFDHEVTLVARKIVERQLMSDLPGPIDDRSQTMALIVGNEVIGGVVWHNWHPIWRVIEISCATIGPFPWTRGVMQAMAEVPFMCWNVRSIVMRTSEDNERVHRLLPRVGFELSIVPYIRDGEPEYVYVLTDEAWARQRIASDQFKQWFGTLRNNENQLYNRKPAPLPEGNTAFLNRENDNGRWRQGIISSSPSPSS